jgi:hypothetical protein
MFRNFTRLLIFNLFLLTAFFSKDVLSAYIEGTDTTDVNGYGLDSAFWIDNSGYVTGQNIAYYVHGLHAVSGAFNYSFDDINIATDSFSLFHTQYQGKTWCCFVVKNNKDSTYSKVQVIKQLTGIRFTFKYGTNTTPNSRMLEKPDYDRSIRYKPNNLFLINFLNFSWEPPLPNNNHLTGYILFVQKKGISIDTMAPINFAQWDSICFIDSSKTKYVYNNFTPNGEFINIVAVYSEGKSEFLQGWTRLPMPDGIKCLSVSGYFQNKISIQKTSGGFIFNIPKYEKNVILSIYSLMGQYIARLPAVNGNRIFWNARQQNVAYGTYITRVLFPDHTVLTQPFLFTK